MNVEPGTWNQEQGTKTQGPGTKNQEPGTMNQEPGIKNQEPRTRNHEPGTKNKEPFWGAIQTGSYFSEKGISFTAERELCHPPPPYIQGYHYV